MIISRTPLRISFAGGGTDLPAFYENEPGAVVSTTINKYIYINVNQKFDHKIRASYSVTEMVDSLPELKHELIREAMKLLGIEGGIEITSISDIPSSGTGLGSSSSYTVGLLNALHAYKGVHAGADRLGREACEIEIELCGKPIGKQDQYIAAYGGLKYIQFNPDGSVFVDPVICPMETKSHLQSRLLMLYTNLTRSADSILSEQNTNTRSGGSKRQALSEMKAQADALRVTLQEGKLDDFGRILDEGWQLKKSLASCISNPEIDDWYATGLKHGAKGGKLLGAGGGGFLLFYAYEEYHDSIKRALPHLTPQSIHLEPQGSKIVYVEES